MEHQYYLTLFIGFGLGFFFAIFLIGIVELIMHEKGCNRSFIADNWKQVRKEVTISVILFVLLIVTIWIL